MSYYLCPGISPARPLFLALPVPLSDAAAFKSSRPAEAHQVLSRNDIVVTNQSDKDTQLAKLLALNSFVVEQFRQNVEQIV